ncbi:MAG: asparagine synthase (glutamine-hydrolyzing) [Pseudomonadota bacterium]|nr:asparagine synthase (glutamine-hydrolyzing) [Pseudomonadota bacterium]
MCGIAGIFALDAASPNLAALEAMARSIKHRGPDDDGVFQDGPVGLASTRLSILDLSPKGHMPMVDDESGMVIVHNGEIYNFKELRTELGEHRFRTDTDTEVVLKAFATWGENCLEKLNGIFAFAIWDPRKRRLSCARDRLGVKPFLFSQYRGKIIFGSEAKALFEAGVPAVPNMNILADFLVHGIYDHSAETFFEGIEQLLPGHLMTIDESGIDVRRYWDLVETGEWDKDPDRLDDAAYRTTQARFLELLEDAVRLQLRSDVPVSVNASGGLDSSLMVTTLDRLSGRKGDHRLFSYCYGKHEFDERPEVEALAAGTGWAADFFELSAGDVPTMTEEAIHFQEQPFPGIVTLARHNLVKYSRTDFKVLIEGQGGDEIAAGYQYTIGPHILDLMQNGRSDLASAEILAFGRRNGLSDANALKKCMNGLMAYHGTGHAADGNRFVRPDCVVRDLSERARKPAFEKPFRSHLKNMQYRDLFHTKLPRILRSVDRASMAYGREIRVPLLDHRLVEFAFSLPASHKIKDGAQRAFIRDAVMDSLPTSHFNAPKKAVVDPQREWLMGALAGWVEDLISSESFASRGVFDPSAVRKAFREFKDGKSATSYHVWQWVNVELWLRHWKM